MKLYFANPFFNDGVNVTVRRGVKWSLATGEVPIVDVDSGAEVGTAKITGCKVKRLCDITASDVENEHDPACRCWIGLLAEMRKLYGCDFDENEIVTILEFTIV